MKVYKIWTSLSYFPKEISMEINAAVSVLSPSTLIPKQVAISLCVFLAHSLDLMV